MAGGKYNGHEMTQPEIPFCVPYIDEREVTAVARVLRGKWLTTGPEVGRFEQEFRAHLGASWAAAVSSCTAAIEVALAALNIGPGDEVITTAYTFAATVTAVIHRGAYPLLVDVEEDTFNIDPRLVAAAIAGRYRRRRGGLYSPAGRRLRAILPVHFAGQPADMTAINRIAAEHGLSVIEDAAHAVGAAQQGIPVGRSRNLVCFSFYSNKTMTTGEGGMVTGCDPELERPVRLFALHGITADNIHRYRHGQPHYDIAVDGYKANMSDILAALGRVQLAKLTRILGLRRRIAAWYDRELSGIGEIRLPHPRPGNDPAWHLYPILLHPRLRTRRDDVIAGLRRRGVVSSMHFIPVHQHSFFRRYYGSAGPRLPVCEELAEREISLPIYPGMRRGEVIRVAAALRETLAHPARRP